MNLELSIWNYALLILAIFWGLRAEEMGAKGRGAEDRGLRIKAEGRGLRNTNTPTSSTFSDCAL